LERPTCYARRWSQRRRDERVVGEREVSKRNSRIYVTPLKKLLVEVRKPGVAERKELWIRRVSKLRRWGFLDQRNVERGRVPAAKGRGRRMGSDPETAGKEDSAG